jgi:hypothetical protein
MPDTREDLDDRIRLLEPAYAIFRDFLVLRAGDAALASELLHEAIATTLSAHADSPLTLETFPIAMLKVALRALGDRDETTRVQAQRSAVDLTTVLTDGRELLRSTDEHQAMVEAVIDSFARASQRNLVHQALTTDAPGATLILDHAVSPRFAARLLLRANGRLRIAMHRRALREASLDPNSNMSTIEDIGRWTLRRHMQKIAIECLGNFDVDAWFADWLLTPDAALDDLRPNQLLNTRAGRERLTDEYLRHVIHREQDRLQMQRLFVEPTHGEPTKVVDRAYAEALRRFSQRE